YLVSSKFIPSLQDGYSSSRLPLSCYLSISFNELFYRFCGCKVTAFFLFIQIKSQFFYPKKRRSLPPPGFQTTGIKSLMSKAAAKIAKSFIPAIPRANYF
ncbi:MAG: hypothetical protein PHI28_19115, partial [Mangrovibacterium sp.]|nr:hypothetical protein [Mangrovibacterium sp.]